MMKLSNRRHEDGGGNKVAALTISAVSFPQNNEFSFHILYVKNVEYYV
jgi:hypothetical protein